MGAASAACLVTAVATNVAAVSHQSSQQITNNAHFLGIMLEVANTVLVSFGLSEIMLRRRRILDLRYFVATLLALNVLLSPRSHAAVSALLASSPELVGVATASIPAEESNTVTSTMSPEQSADQPSSGWYACHRVLALLTGFTSLAYADVQRLRPPPFGILAFFK
ncbi:unnamed protein product, partial [Polarella glacialis]